MGMTPSKARLKLYFELDDLALVFEIQLGLAGAVQNTVAGFLGQLLPRRVERDGEVLGDCTQLRTIERA